MTWCLTIADSSADIDWRHLILLPPLLKGPNHIVDITLGISWDRDSLPHTTLYELQKKLVAGVTIRIKCKREQKKRVSIKNYRFISYRDLSPYSFSNMSFTSGSVYLSSPWFMKHPVEDKMRWFVIMAGHWFDLSNNKLESWNGITRLFL